MFVIDLVNWLLIVCDWLDVWSLLIGLPGGSQSAVDHTVTHVATSISAMSMLLAGSSHAGTCYHLPVTSCCIVDIQYISSTLISR